MAIDGAYIYTEGVDKESASVVIDLSFREKRASGAVSLAVLSPSMETVAKAERYCDEPLVKFRLDIPRAELWYPHGYGDQPLYTLVVSTGGRELYRERFGIRTVKIMQLPDKKGSPYDKKADEVHNLKYDFNEEHSGFILKVNGRRIFCQGANYVPCEPFMHGDTAKKQTELLLLARDMGVNMIRMWGGGDFETRHFYDECSRLGIMVTQDFLMACGSYPEGEDWFIDELSKEARCAALRLRNQPCLVWWSGDNENAVHGNDLEPDYKGRRSAFFGIAPVLYKLDPHRPFLPSSPFGGKKYASNTVGTTHNTAYLGCLIIPYLLKGDAEDYKEFFHSTRARFIAEEPQLGAISETSIKRFMTDEDIFGDDLYMWNYHTKNNPGLQTSVFDTMQIFAKSLLGDFKDGADRYFKYRYLQYEWVRITLEQLRREAWFSSGMIYWMLNDCWPAASGWSIIDFYNLPKDAYYAFKRCSGKLVLSFDKTEGAISLYASAKGEDISGATLTVYKLKDGAHEKIYEGECEAIPDGSRVIYTYGDELSDGEVLIADIEANGICDRTFYKNGSLKIKPAAARLTVNKKERTVTVSSDEYIHAIELSSDAIFSDNCFSLLPGEERTVSYTENTDGDIKLTAYTLEF
jgi:beta-mannosidase